MKTLLIVDDHEGYRSFVATMLDGGEFTVTGQAEDGTSALDEVRRLAPDLVLLDIQMPGLDGFEVASRIADLSPRPIVILTSTRDAVDFGTRLEEAPVLGFVPKHEISVDALLALLHGHLDGADA